ncbi:MAG: amino acid racemase [Acidobacteriota bacterium]|nr:amino acid racemase [Acidobacteriota bacterium]
MKKTIGILGGMGPEATVHMFELIIKNTKAEKDQDHIPVIIYSNPKIPPRTDAVFNKGPSPTPFLIEGAELLEKAGADFIIMPCITAHYFFHEVAAHVSIPFLNLLEESLLWIKRNIPGIKTAGIISSTGTLESRLFHNTLGNEGIEVINPNKNEQQKVMKAIFGEKGIKAGYTSGAPKEIIIQIAHSLIQRGAEAIIAGCTEVPLVLTSKDISVPLIEPMSIIARVSIKKAGYELT